MKRPSSLPVHDGQEQYHVVLVEPGDSLNVGAVARAMMNLGFSHLHLVAPPRYDPAQAAVTACWAEGILTGAGIHDTLADALAPMEQVVGFSARHGKNRPRHLLLPDWIELNSRRPAGPTALLFGPEDTGLRREHLPYCHWLVRLPSNESNPSFNLAQAVLLSLFELSRAGWDATPRPRRESPPASDFFQLDSLVDEVLTRARFYRKGTPEPVPDTVRHMLRRMEPDRREMSILLGIFGKINRVLEGKAPVAPFPKAEEEGDE